MNSKAWQLCDHVSLVQLCDHVSLVQLCDHVSLVQLCDHVSLVKLCDHVSLVQLCDHVSLVQYHQPTRCSKICFIDSFRLALHVLGDSFAHLQEHFVYTAFWNNVPTLLSVADWQQTGESVLFSKKLYIQSKCSWRWAKLSPKTCRASLKESIKQILLHLVGWWYRWIQRHLCSPSDFHK